MAGGRLSRNLTVMNEHLMTAMATEHMYALRADAVRRRRGRFAQLRTRRAEARRARHLRVAHA
jgi:hypothetical protein